MLEPFRLDLEFAANIRRIADNTETLSRSLAVIAGLLAKREGVNFSLAQPCQQDNKPDTATPMQPTTPDFTNQSAFALGDES